MGVIGPDWLQGGALALAIIILIFVYRWINTRLKRDSAQLDKQAQFLQDMVTEASAERKAQVLAWQNMMETNIETREKTTSAMRELTVNIDGLNKSMVGMITGLDGVNESLKRTCDLQTTRHAELVALHKE